MARPKRHCQTDASVSLYMGLRLAKVRWTELSIDGDIQIVRTGMCTIIAALKVLLSDLKYSYLGTSIWSVKLRRMRARGVKTKDLQYTITSIYTSKSDRE